MTQYICPEQECLWQGIKEDCDVDDEGELRCPMCGEYLQEAED
jgi:hypothetical protein